MTGSRAGLGFAAKLRLAQVGAVTWAALALGACEQPAPKTPPQPAVEDADTLYSRAAIPRFGVFLAPSSIEALGREPKTYVPGAFAYNGTTIVNVGVRLKGNITLTTLDEKPSLKIKFNKFKRGQKFLGLESLTLHNMHSDASLLREHLAYSAFAAAGLPAQRTGYARVTINDEDYGLYLNLETPDDSFLERAFEDPTGNLYEGENNDDLDEDVSTFEHDEGSNDPYEDLEALAQWALRDDNSVFYDPASPLDRELFLRYIATEAYVGQFDGYWTSHNYFMYHEPASDRWVWLPWSLDQSFARRIDMFDGGGFLKEKCIADDRCRVDYIREAEGVAARIKAADLAAEGEAAARFIEVAASEDTRKRHSDAAVRSSQAAVIDWVGRREDEVVERLDCLVDGADPDRDGDGFGSCHHDCDDSNAAVRPGEPESCDGVDNDCSGFADDVPECTCPIVEHGDARFFLCPYERTWLQARDFCSAQGHDLARIDDEAANEAIRERAQALRSGRWAIGLHDRDEEGVYRWQDGAVADYTAWADGEPAHQLEWFDCVFMDAGASGRWRELNCIEQGSFVCRER